MGRSLRLALVLVEATSLPLLILTILYILSGYQLLYPGVYLLPASRTIHTDPILRVLFVVLTYLHSLAGLILVIERRVRSGMVKAVLEYLAIIGLSVFMSIALTLDIVLRFR